MDWNAVRSHFPIVGDYVFFNHAAVSPIPDVSLATLKQFGDSAVLQGSEAIPQWSAMQEEVRDDVAGFIGAHSEEVAFIPSTSYGLSIVANGVEWKPGDNVIVPDLEFPSNIYPWMNLQRLGVELRWWRSRNGRLFIHDLRELLDSRTRVITISGVQWASGYRADLGLISTLAKEYDVLLCVDAIQQAGAMPFNVKELGIDFAAADGHKWMLSVEGLGFFYSDLNALDRIHTSTVGWKSVINPLEFHVIDFTLQSTAARFETGSLNSAGIYALGASVKFLDEIGPQRIFERILSLIDQIVEGLKARGMAILSSLEERERSGILIFTTKDRDKELFDIFRRNKVAVSLRGGGIRVSPHCYNNEEDVQRFFDVLDEALDLSVEKI